MISRKRWAAAAIAAIAVIGLALSGCTSAESDTAATDSSTADEPVYGGTLHAIDTTPVVGFDPIQVASSTTQSFAYTSLYGQFVVPDLETGTYVCGLCESFETSDGGLTWEITTREGMTFTDGTPFDAEALKYNWERIKDPANGSGSAGYAGQIDSFEVVDDVTLKLVMTTANPGFLSNFATYALQWIASPTALAAGTEEFNENPIGAGPFVFKSWVPNGTLTLERNPDYYDSPLPYLDAVEIQGVSDTDQRVNALISGSADIIHSLEGSVLTQAEDAGFVVHEYIFNGGLGIMFNTSKAPFDDVRARQALAYGLDFEKIGDAFTGGNPEVPTTLFTKDSPYYEDIPLTTYDPEKAQELLDELAADGKPLDFTFTTTSSATTTVFDAIQAQLNSYDNVSVTIDIRDASEAGIFASEGDFEATTTTLAFADPLGRLFTSLHSKAGVSNYSRFSDPETDAAIDAAGKTTDVDELRKQYAIVQERLADQAPFLFFDTFRNGVAATEQVQGVTVFGFTSPGTASIWLKP
ncbi:MAG: ABC transporter substrate-binding protein [Microbacterium sp.]